MFDLAAARQDKLSDDQIMGILRNHYAQYDVDGMVKDHGLDKAVEGLNSQVGRETQVDNPTTSPQADVPATGDTSGVLGKVSDALSAGGKEMVDSLPLVKSLGESLSGQNPYRADQPGYAGTGLARAAGDFGGTVMLGKLGPKAAFKFSGVQGALKALGVTDAAQGIAKKAENAPEPTQGDMFQPEGSKQFVTSGSGVVSNFLRQIPRTLKQTAAEQFPGVVAGTAAAEAGAPKVSEAPLTSAQLLEKYGGETTPGMRKGTPGVRTALDGLARANPLFTAGMMAKIGNRNVEAMQKFVKEKLGERTDPYESGKALEGILSESDLERKADYKSVLDRVNNAALPKGKRSGLEAVQALAQWLNEQKSGDPNSALHPDVGNIFEGLLETLPKAHSVGDLRNQMGRVKIDQGKLLETLRDKSLKGSLETQFGKGWGVLNGEGGVLDRLLGASDDKALLGDWKAVNKKYAQGADALNPAFKAIDRNSAENYYKQILSNKNGIEYANQLKTQLGEKFGAFQDVAVQHLLKDSQNPQTSALSLAKLNTNLAKLGPLRDILLKPEDIQSLQQLKGMMESAHASELAFNNSSGTAGKAVGHAALASAGTGALLGHPGPLASWVGGSGLMAGYLKSPKLLDAIKNGATKDLGGPKLPFDIQPRQWDFQKALKSLRNMDERQNP